jgi:hypothetical protein
VLRSLRERAQEIALPYSVCIYDSLTHSHAVPLSSVRQGLLRAFPFDFQQARRFLITAILGEGCAPLVLGDLFALPEYLPVPGEFVAVRLLHATRRTLTYAQSGVFRCTVMVQKLDAAESSAWYYTRHGAEISPGLNASNANHVAAAGTCVLPQYLMERKTCRSVIKSVCIRYGHSILLANTFKHAYL